VADSLSQVAGELYGLPPAEFTAARDDRARQARTAGDSAAAAQIRKLTRPTVSAWLVNQLARSASPLMSRLYEIAQALQDAQRELAGDRLRELAVERRQLIAGLMPEASRLAAAAGVNVSGGTLDEVRATLEAALADAGAREAVQSGQLTKPISYAGLGEVDLAAALAAPALRKAGRPGKAAAPSDDEPDRGDSAIAAVQAAEQAAEAAARDLAAAETRSAGLAEQRQFLSRRIAHLQAELGRAESDDRELAKTARDAQRTQDAAAKALARARRALDQARARAGQG
jgi:hypothetical protein